VWGVDQRRAERFAKNEALFRTVNDRIADVGAAFDIADERATEFVCECANIDCTDRLRIPFDDYRRVRSDRLWFVVAAGHEVPDVETVVEDHGAYRVVEKTEAEAVAEAAAG
jgi:hypothetical protein